MLRILEGFGLSRVESDVYVYLAKIGPSKAQELTVGLRMTKQQLYPTLRGLKKKGIVSSKPERSALFNALAFEELLNRYVKINVEQAGIIREAKEELLNSWRKMSEQSNT